MKAKRLMICFAVLLSVCLMTGLCLASFQYEIGEQHEILTVQQDGVIMLDKEFTFHVLPYSSDDGTEIWVGLPTDSTRVLNAVYVANGIETPVKYSVDSEDSEYHVTLTKFPPIKPGETGRFRFTARIPDLIYWRDKKEPGKSPAEQKVSLSFVPAWWDKAMTRSLSVMIDFESDLRPEDLEFTQTQPSIGAQPEQKLRLVWDYSDLQPGEKRKHAVIIPRQYFSATFHPQRNWLPTWVVLFILGFVFLGIGLLIWAIMWSIKNKRYQTPVAYMKGDKAYTSFDPIEAALFYKVPPDLLAKMIVMGLLKKNIIKLESDQLRRVNSIERLTWYEELFLDSVNDRVVIIPEKWKPNYEEIVKHFFEMVKGYCGRQTTAHYNKWLKATTFTESDDPRWVVLQQQLSAGVFDHSPKEEVLRQTMPGYLNPFFPLFYLTIVQPPMAKINNSYYSHVFPGTTGGTGNSGGTGCACACACACASSGGCT